MVNGGIEITNSRILDKIRYHKFGAVVAVTNGIINPERRYETRKQVKNGKSILEKAVGDSAKIQGGLALIRNTEEDITDLDFVLQILDYEPRLLLKISERTLKNNLLDKEDAGYLSRILNISNMAGPEYLMGLLNQNRRRTRFGPRRGRKKYPYNDQSLAKIKEVILKNYVKALFNRVLENDHSFGLDITMRDQQVCPDKEYHADMIIAADQSDLVRGLDKLVKMMAEVKTSKARYGNMVRLSSSHGRYY